MSVLVVTHLGDEVLHKLHLVRLGPLFKILDAEFLLLLIACRQLSLLGHNHTGSAIGKFCLEQEVEKQAEKTNI